MSEYFILRYRGDMVAADGKWVNHNIKFHCCGHIDYTSLYDPITVVDHEFVSKYIMGIIVTPDVYYFRKDFLGYIYSDLLELGAQFGDIVSNVTGKIYDNWKTVSHSLEVFVRGGTDSLFWICPKCKELRYLWQNKPYVLSSQIADKRIILVYEGLIIDSTIHAKLTSLTEWQKMKRKIAIVKLPILDHPQDGFPINLHETSPTLFRTHDRSICRQC